MTSIDKLNLNIDILKIFFSSLRWQDYLDLALTTLFIYFIFWFLRRTKSWRAFFSILFLFFLYVLSYWLNLSVTYKFLGNIAGVLIIILVLIFQDEIRRIFYLIGSWGKKVDYSSYFIDKLKETVFEMAKNKTGALIVIPGKEDIHPYFINKGFEANAKFSKPLLLSIFDDSSPGHDGAVILDGEIIKEFGVYLPLSKDIKQTKNYGTRHSAGLGITEKTDALSIIVSEEKGKVSIAHHKKLKEVNEDEFLNILGNFIKSLSKEKGKNENFLLKAKRNLWLIFVSLILSSALWVIIIYPNLGIVQKSFVVPLEFINVEKGYIVSDIRPQEVVATFSGRNQDFKFLDPASLKISIDLKQNKTLGKNKFNLSKEYLKYPSSLILLDLKPDVVQFVVNKVEEENISNKKD
jgi:uncharacterized protein (TIGR00159 family)